MNALARKMGLSDELAFYDVYSLDEPELLASIPRPAYALLATVPFTQAWKRDRAAEDAALRDGGGAAGAGDAEKAGDEPILWFRQTINNACGSYGLLHCVANGPASKFILPGSTLDRLRADALPLTADERAQMLYDSAEFEDAHGLVSTMGDTSPPLEGSNGENNDHHFVAFVKANGRIWELEGSRPGPLDRGALGDDEDVLSPRALELGLKRIIKLDQDAGGQEVRFSCIALAPRVT